MGLWGRIFQGQGSQFALVAAVLVAGVFVAKFAGDSENPTMAPAADISAVEEPAPPPVPVATPMEAVELQDESEAAAELPSAAPEEKSVAAQLVEPRAPSEPEPTARDRGESDRRQRTKGPAAKKDSRPARRRMTKGTAAPSTLELDTPDDRAASRTRQGRALDRPLAEAQREPDRAVDVVERESAPAPMAAKAEAKPTSEGAPAYRPQAGTIAAVEQRARANDYNGTIAASDAFLAADTGSATERARALQLKADALLRLGRYAEADRVYASIQQDYPTYQTTAVNSARARIQERQSRQPARRNSVAPASSDPE